MHFAHANGFPPAAYSAFVERFTDRFRCVGMETRPLWEGSDPSVFRNWEEMADDMGRFLSNIGESGVIAVGHSMGGVISLLCAAKRPRLVRALVLIDPVILPVTYLVLWQLRRVTGTTHRFRLSEGARKRRTRWSNREEMLNAYRAKPLFAGWDERFLKDYIECGTVDDGRGGIVLRFPTEWEARIFETPPFGVWLQMRKAKCPVLVIRGERSDTYLESSVRLMKVLMPGAVYVEIPGAGHFVPMDSPSETVEAMNTFFEAEGITPRPPE